MMDIKCQEIGFVEANEQAPVVWATINELCEDEGHGRREGGMSHPCGGRRKEVLLCGGLGMWWHIHTCLLDTNTIPHCNLEESS